jgi:hypothetical protein
MAFALVFTLITNHPQPAPACFCKTTPKAIAKPSGSSDFDIKSGPNVDIPAG